MASTAVSARPVWRLAALSGLITGLLCVAWVLFLYFTDNNPYGPKRTLSDFFPPLAAIASQILLRRYYADGPGLGRALGVGLLTTLFSAAVAAAGIYLFSRLTGPALIAQHLEQAHQLLAATKQLYLKEANGMAQYQATLRNLARTPAGFAQDEFFHKIWVGILLGIPGGIFLRK